MNSSSKYAAIKRRVQDDLPVCVFCSSVFLLISIKFCCARVCLFGWLCCSLDVCINICEWGNTAGKREKRTVRSQETSQCKEKTDYEFIYRCIHMYKGTVPIVDKRHKRNPNHILVLTSDFRWSIHPFHYHKLRRCRAAKCRRNRRSQRFGHEWTPSHNNSVGRTCSSRCSIDSFDYRIVRRWTNVRCHRILRRRRYTARSSHIPRLNEESTSGSSETSDPSWYLRRESSVPVKTKEKDLPYFSTVWSRLRPSYPPE